MAAHEVGIRIDPQKGIAFFGLEEVNQKIAAGERIIAIRPGGAVMAKTGTQGEKVTVALSGCQIQVVFADA